jgi:hypothetical protein
LKKPTGSVWFRFYKPETEKTEPNPNKKKPIQTKKTKPNRKKPSQTGLNRFLSKKSNRTETGRFEPVSVFFLNSIWLFFFNKNRTE